MSYWICIIGSKMSYERFVNSTTKWFCLPKSCEVDDEVVMYSSTAAAGKNSGAFAVYKVVKKDPLQDQNCKSYGSFSLSGDRSVYVEMSLIDNFPKPIHSSVIRNHPFLGGCTFARRNFQGTCFDLNVKEFRVLNLVGRSFNV